MRLNDSVLGVVGLGLAWLVGCGSDPGQPTIVYMSGSGAESGSGGNGGSEEPIDDDDDDGGAQSSSSSAASSGAGGGETSASSGTGGASPASCTVPCEELYQCLSESGLCLVDEADFVDKCENDPDCGDLTSSVDPNDCEATLTDLQQSKPEILQLCFGDAGNSDDPMLPPEDSGP